MRKDGIRVKDLDPTHKIMPYLMKGRTEAEVYQTETIDITKLMKYLDKINNNRKDKITLFHAIITAMAKTVYNRPLLNRFIAGRRFYDRNNISFSFVAKNKLDDNSEERLIILKTKYDMNLFDISDIILQEVTKTRKANSNEMNDTLGFVTSFPRCITSLIMNIFRIMDYFGVVPKSISDTDPNYSTILLSNLGSIKCNSCYHHLNNYGTNSIVSTIGVIRDIKEKANNEKTANKKYVDISFTLDERIADGFYFAKSIKLFKYILENPKLLEDELSSKIDIENK
ncbi:MAG: 2-oxo acid dehydrogenase subunit E2 [bacterium]|nr:2-oxo acid dehydrogenase subunit E2 [bacterium]